MAHRVSKTDVASLEYLRLSKLRWADRHGVEHDWDLASRIRTPTGGVVGVDVCAVVSGDGVEPRVVVITQYRPPIDAVSAEFPAGVVDEGETPATAALRELKEETGYVGDVVSVAAPSSHDCGMTDSKFWLVVVKVDLSRAENKAPKQELEGGEDITVHLVPKSQLVSRLEEWAATDSVVPDGKLRAFACGLALAV